MGVLDTLIYGYRTIKAAGTALTQRKNLNFASGFTVADNVGTSATDVSVAPISVIAGSGGNVNVTCNQSTWGSSGQVISITGETTTTTNAANQVIATIAMGAQRQWDVFVRIAGTDTAAAGGYRGTWADDALTRRTGVNSGNAQRKGTTPTVTNEKKWDSLASAVAFDVNLSTNDVQIRVSPGATANVKWRYEVCILEVTN